MSDLEELDNNPATHPLLIAEKLSEQTARQIEENNQELHERLIRRHIIISHLTEEEKRKLYLQLQALYEDLDESICDVNLTPARKLEKLLSTYAKVLKYLPILEAELEQASSASHFLMLFKTTEVKTSLAVLGAMLGMVAIGFELRHYMHDPYLTKKEYMPIISAELLSVCFGTMACFTSGITCGLTLSASFIFMAIADYRKVKMYQNKLSQLETEYEFLLTRQGADDVLAMNIARHIEDTRKVIHFHQTSFKFNSSLSVIACTGCLLMAIPGINAPILGITCAVLLAAMLAKAMAPLIQKARKYFRCNKQPRIDVASSKTPMLDTLRENSRDRRRSISSKHGGYGALSPRPGIEDLSTPRRTLRLS